MGKWTVSPNPVVRAGIFLPARMANKPHHVSGLIKQLPAQTPLSVNLF
jgi:hypothetical protein